MKKQANVRYGIAGHVIELSIPHLDSYPFDEKLPSFKPFKLPDADVYAQPMTQLNILSDLENKNEDEAVVLCREYYTIGYFYRLKETEQNYIFDIQNTPNGNWSKMICVKDFSTADAVLDIFSSDAGPVLSNMLMMLFAQRCVIFHTCLLHASVVEKDGSAYAFLGKSGTGKSTHSSLWLRYLSNVTLLNDDNPAVRLMEDGRVIIYGTPWSGKTHCYQNKEVPLNAFVRLKQAPHNTFRHLSDVAAFVALLPSCSSMRWNSGLHTKLCDLIENLVSRVKVGELECLPNKEAAELCYNELLKL